MMFNIHTDSRRAYDELLAAEQVAKDAEQRVTRMQKQLMKTIEDDDCTEYTHAFGKIWIAKRMLADANRRALMARKRLEDVLIKVEGILRLEYLFANTGAIAFLKECHMAPVYQVETDCFKAPNSDQQKIIRNFEKLNDCHVYFVIEQLFPFPKESDDIHPTTAYLFFENSFVRGKWLDTEESDGSDLAYFPEDGSNEITYAYVKSDVEPYSTITATVVKLTESGGLQRQLYSKWWADIVEWTEAVNAKKTKPDNPE